jgi:FkbM family methyltransferase
MVASYLYKFCIKNANKRGTYYWEKIWKKFVVPNSGKSSLITIHNKQCHVPIGYMYPIFARNFKQYNNPLLELAFETYQNKKKRINIIDVGAAIGDTIALIEANIPNVIEKGICIDGDKQFFSFLERNFKDRKDILCVQALLSDSSSIKENELIRTHLGTASAQGVNKQLAKTLDELSHEHNFPKIDLLKIDVDGFDGKVLNGSKNLISKDKPNIIFEWHPILYEKTKNDPFTPFKVLNTLQYSNFIFYTKYGSFSHLMVDVNIAELKFLVALCLGNKHDFDWHYDVIAIPDISTINLQSLAELSFSKNAKSKY